MIYRSVIVLASIEAESSRVSRIAVQIEPSQGSTHRNPRRAARRNFVLRLMTVAIMDCRYYSRDSAVLRRAFPNHFQTNVKACFILVILINYVIFYIIKYYVKIINSKKWSVWVIKKYSLTTSILRIKMDSFYRFIFVFHCRLNVNRNNINIKYLKNWNLTKGKLVW